MRSVECGGAGQSEGIGSAKVLRLPAIIVKGAAGNLDGGCWADMAHRLDPSRLVVDIPFVLDYTQVVDALASVGVHLAAGEGERQQKKVEGTAACAVAAGSAVLPHMEHGKKWEKIQNHRCGFGPHAVGQSYICCMRLFVCAFVHDACTHGYKLFSIVFELCMLSTFSCGSCGCGHSTALPLLVTSARLWRQLPALCSERCPEAGRVHPLTSGVW
jgi:hypothetical protein